jgi:NADH-quinone oxidoreductase subunit C
LTGVGSTEPRRNSEWDVVPGLVEVVEKHRETTIVVDPESVVDAGTWLRDEAGFNFLSDITAVDYLGWGEKGVSGYIGTTTGRDLNTPMTQGYQVVPLPKPQRFAINYHLLSVSERPRRVRLQTWLADGQAVQTVIPVWPTADWHEREAFDLMGITFAGHPNLQRILLDDDWAGHPLRKDYPIGGEPVRFSEEK